MGGFIDAIKKAIPSWDLNGRITRLEKQMERVMSVETDLAAKLDAVVAELPTIVTSVTSLQAQVVALQGSSNLNPTDQAALDQASKDAETLTTSIGNLSAALNPPPPAAAPVADAAVKPAAGS